MSAVACVLLDAGGVLVHPNWEVVATALRRNGVAADAEALGGGEARARFDLDTPRCCPREQMDQNRDVTQPGA